MYSARFITFEGGEGVGKSTQIKLLSAKLSAAGVEVAKTRQPGGTERGMLLRKLLVTGDIDRWSAMAEALLMLADREVHLAEMIRPKLDAGCWVLCDRFMDSTRVYQGIAGEVGLKTIDQLQALIIGDTIPDLTFILDLPAEIGLARAKVRGGETRFEQKGLAYHQKIRTGFLDLAAREAERFIIIDASKDVETIAAIVLAHVQQKLMEL